MEFATKCNGTSSALDSRSWFKGAVRRASLIVADAGLAKHPLPQPMVHGRGSGW